MALLLSTLFVFESHARVICTSGDCNIDCSSQNCDTIICTNEAASCTINCHEDECNTSDFYLSASDYNTVDCNGADSCNGINIECGLPNNIPSGYNPSDFIGHINACTVMLRNNAISNDGRIECMGNIDLCQLYALTDNNDFSGSQFECRLTSVNAQCIINCNANKSCGDGTSIFQCIAPQCQCIGNGCNKITESIDPTRAPTDRPSRNPSTMPAVFSTELGAIPTTMQLVASIDDPTDTRYPFKRLTESPTMSTIPIIQTKYDENILNDADMEAEQISDSSGIIPDDIIYIFTSILTGLFCMMFAICCCIRICYDYHVKVIELEQDNIEGIPYSDGGNNDTSDTFSFDGAPTSQDEETEHLHFMINYNSGTTDNTLPSIPEHAAPPHITFNSTNSSGLVPSIPSIPHRLCSLKESDTEIDSSYSSEISIPRNSSSTGYAVRHKEQQPLKQYTTITELVLNRSVSVKKNDQSDSDDTYR